CPFSGAAAEAGVRSVLRSRRFSCLERSLVLQRWLDDGQTPCDVIIGVRSDRGLGAHAWIEGLEDAGQFTEIARVQPISGRLVRTGGPDSL
nr:lasso peptide biosynthesis B2 protein [Solirubrobacterales bacterium]